MQEKGEGNQGNMVGFALDRADLLPEEIARNDLMKYISGIEKDEESDRASDQVICFYIRRKLVKYRRRGFF